MLKIITLPYLSDFDKILYTTAYLELDDSHVTKYDFFFNSRWQTAYCPFSDSLCEEAVSQNVSNG